MRKPETLIPALFPRINRSSTTLNPKIGASTITHIIGYDDTIFGPQNPPRIVKALRYAPKP